MRFLAALLVAVMATVGTGWADDLVRAYLDGSPDTLRRVLATGHRTVLHRRDRFIDVVVPPGRLDELNRLCRTRILQRSMDRYVASLTRRADWGAYHTADELRQRLEDWETRYPSLVHVDSIGHGWDTQRGLAHRPILAVTCGIPRPGKPAVLLVGGIHAREIATVDSVLLLLDELLARAATDSATAALLDRVVIHAVPCLNPDGRELVFTGRIWWRKNARPAADGHVVGVDLNRNFGFHFGSNTPRGGSTGSAGSETFRGPTAFSEPETQALRDYVLARPDIVASLSFHSYGGFLLVPFGYNGAWPPHERLYREVGALISQETDWAVGTVHELLGYYSNGRHDDWLYGALTPHKERILAFQVEIGDTFFTETQNLPVLAQRTGSVVRRLMQRAALPPAVTLEARRSDDAGTVTGALTVTNRQLGSLDELAVTLVSPLGNRYAACSGLTLAGDLRGAGPTSVRRLVPLSEAEASGRFGVTVTWRGGRHLTVVDVEAPYVRSVLED